jgi:hypothetical protein
VAPRGKPLRALTYDDLELYIAKALTTWGTLQTFEYYAPRLLDLLSFGGESGTYRFCDPSAPLSSPLPNFEYADWRNWPARERRAIAQWMSALWKDGLRENPESVVSLAYRLDAVAFMEGEDGSLEEYLDAAAPCLDIDRAPLLARLTHDLEPHSFAGFTQRGNVPDARADELEAWLRNPDRIAALEEAFFQRLEHSTPTDSTTERLADAVDMLQTFEQSPWQTDWRHSAKP